MAQVKFYSVASLPSTPDAGGVYFVNNGELYKGTQRFGLGRVDVDGSFNPTTSTKSGQAKGDIVVTGSGAGWVFDGTSWQSIGGDVADIKAIVSSMTSGLVAGGTGSYITGITQDEDGNVTANAVAFPELTTGDADGQVKLNGVNATVSGWSGVKTDIANLQAVVSYSGSGDSVVTATTGSFTNLTVTSTATFEATEVSAGSLTVGGVDVDNVAASSASGNDAGIAVTVSTLGGGVEAVGVAVTSATLLSSLALTDFAGKSVVTTVGASGTASDDNIATEKAVRDAIATLTNVMHFKGVVTSLPASAESGDIVVIGADPASGLVEGQEYIYDGTKWEKIGDQSAVTGGSDSDVKNGITVSVAIATATAAPDVTLTVSAATTAADVSDANKASNVVTAGAVNAFVTGITDTKASVGTSTTASTHGVSATMTLASNAAPTIGITVDAITASTGVQPNEDRVVTAGAVADYVADAINRLDASVSSSENTGLKVGVEQVDGVVTAVTADILWLDANGTPITA